jgi:outer membrane protein assembly factor BamB
VYFNKVEDYPMLRKHLCAVAFFALGLSLFAASLSAAESLLISEADAQRHGLERMWFLQADVNRGRSKLLDLKLYEGVLYLITDTATVQAIDAETGASLWSKQIGKPDRPSMPISVGGDMVAALNGSSLIVLNRHNGDVLFEHLIEDAPGGGPCVNSRRVYVPMTTGMIEGFQIDLIREGEKEEEIAKEKAAAQDENAAQDEDASKEEAAPKEDSDLQEGTIKDKAADPKATTPNSEAQPQGKLHVNMRPVLPLFFRSKGRTLVQPLALRESPDDEFVSWPTDEGYLYIGRVNRHNELYLEICSRIKANAPITIQPAYLPPTKGINPEFGIIFFGSDNGIVTAISEDGVVMWQCPAGDPIVQSPVSIGERVYFSTKYGGLYCVDAMPDEAGRVVRNWFATGGTQFLAASKDRVYAADRFGNTLIIDAKTGKRVDSIETSKHSFKFTNVQSDRFYLATPDGVLQCFREIGVKDPLRYDLDRKQAIETYKPVEDKGRSKAKAAEKEEIPAEQPEDDSTPEETP